MVFDPAEQSEMTFGAFETAVREEMRRRFPELFFSLKEVRKLQECPYRALSAGREKRGIAALIRLQPEYEEYRADGNLSAAFERIAESVQAALSGLPSVDPELFEDYGQAKKRLRFRMIAEPGNRERLREMPHRLIGDMACVCYLELEQNGERSAGAPVTREMLAAFGVTEEELFRDAETAAAEQKPALIRSMTEMLGELGGGIYPEAEYPMFVAGVPGGFYGAGVLCYPGFTEQAAEIVGGDYYIIPSSVHELILVRPSGPMDARGLNEMVAEVNRNEVTPEERLSDQAYHYDSSEKLLETALEYEERSAFFRRRTQAQAL